jgi:hypothetical protein
VEESHATGSNPPTQHGPEEQQHDAGNPLGDATQIKNHTIAKLPHSDMSPAAMDFAASGSIEVVATGTTKADQMANTKVFPLSPYHGLTLSLYNHINPAIISCLDLNLDLVLPPYLILSNVVDIIKFIQGDQCSFQRVSKNLLLECLENLDDEEEMGKALVPAAPGALKKRRTKKNIDPVDAKSLRHNTRLNKNQEGFKAVGLATPDQENAHYYVGTFDHGTTPDLPPHLSKENIQTIGLCFLKMQPMAVSDAALFDISDDDKE